MRFTHLHTSSRFDKSPAVLEVHLDRYMAQADLITITEVANGRRPVKLNERGWSHHKPGKNYRDDSTVLWKNEKFTVIHEESYQTSKDRGDQKDVPYCAFVVLETQDCKRIVVGSGHLPHGIETEIVNRRYVSRNARAYVSEFRGFKKRGNQLKRKYKAQAVILAADWNVNIKRKFATNFFKALAPSYKIAIAAGSAWTHAGGRLIDFTLYKGKIRLAAKPVILKQDKSSDHRPYKETFVV